MFLQVDMRIKRYTYISNTTWDFDVFASHAKTLNSCEGFVVWSNQISDSDSDFFIYWTISIVHLKKTIRHKSKIIQH